MYEEAVHNMTRILYGFLTRAIPGGGKRVRNGNCEKVKSILSRALYRV